MSAARAAAAIQKDAPVLAQRAAFRRRLLAWYREHARELPWRGTRDAYRVWISEIILQQTRVEQGTPYIERFLRAFPTVAGLARAPLDDVIKQWEGLGYYTRARNLHRAAVMIANERGGVLPRTADEWLAIPGVGRYTAGAIASIAHGEPTPAVDGNVKRVLARLMDLNLCIDDASVTELLWQLSSLLVRGRSPGDFNQGLMELGAQLCVPKSPNCRECPVSDFCLAFKRGTQALRPVRKPKKAVPHKEVVIAAIKKNGRYLLGKRPPEGLLGGLWEFPGGKVEAGETHEQALVREAREELGIEIAVRGFVGTVRHAYSHFTVTLNVYACSHASGTPEPRAHTELRWVSRKQLDEFAFPKANHKFLPLL